MFFLAMCNFKAIDDLDLTIFESFGQLFGLDMILHLGVLLLFHFAKALTNCNL